MSSKYHGVIVGRGIVDWFPSLAAAEDYARLSHEHDGVNVTIVDVTFSPVATLRR